ncbi:GtrA family protein [Paenibacillus sp. FSL R10-2734]|uniref:GtrA family protein n=1 Tax=Paenibacillus sp. FSL R10-2734 TaxID=2954691 RepID=UPI0030DA8CE0
MNDINIETKKTGAGAMGYWNNYKEKHPNIAQFFVFFLLSTGMTILQLVLMPVFKGIFAQTSLVNTSFQWLQFGTNFDGSDYYLFDYGSGSLASGGGGGLAYFLAVQITIGLAQIINFFLQRNITFKSNSNIWSAAFWYVLAYVVITIGAAAAQGFYKAPVYNLLMNTWEMGSFGETAADLITMMINALISFWVFYPIFKVIFKQEPEK